MSEGLIIDLRGTGLPSGEILLADLGALGDALQLLALRIGRDDAGHGGPGRSAGVVERATKLRLRALRPGSAILDIVVGEDLVVDDGIERRTVDRLGDVLAGMAADTVPPWVAPLIGESALRTLDALARTATECRVTSSRWTAPVRFAPAHCSRDIWSTSVSPAMDASPGVEVSGVLEAVDLKPPGRFRLRDDVGNAIPLERVTNIIDARTLIGTRVTALGEASVGPAGQVLRLTDATVTAATLPAWSAPPSAASAMTATTSPVTGGVEGVSDDDVDDFMALVRG